MFGGYLEKKFDIILDYGRKPTYRIQRVMA